MDGQVIVILCTRGTFVAPSTGPMYRLEKQTEPNVAVDLDLTLESQSTLEFCLVRENSKCCHDSPTWTVCDESK